MKKIAVICAMQVELDAIKNLLSDLEEVNIGPRVFFKGIFNEKEIILVKCGIGKVNAAITTALLINEFKPSLIINCGVAGGYSTKLKPLDVVIGNKIFYYDVDCTFGELSMSYGQVQDEPAKFNCSKVLIDLLNKEDIDCNYYIGAIMTADQFATDRAYLSGIIEKHFSDVEVFAVDMESAAIAHTANQFKTDVVIVRSISDVVGVEQDETYPNFLERACYNASTIVSFLLSKVA